MENKPKIKKIEMFDKSQGLLIEDEKSKSFLHPKYNFRFRKKDGFFLRWGETKEANGNETLGLPEICDLEISEVCDGVPGIGPCSFCYKSNTGFKGDQMSFETFKNIFHKLPPTITQIAFGVGTTRKHPEMWDMFKYAKEHGVTPNLTINGDVDDHEFDKIAEYCGACAVSVYDKDLSYNAVKKLTDRGMTQVNIHYMISEETYDGALNVMNDKLTDPRLEKLNAIVLLSLKPKGRATKNHFHKLSQDKFNHLVDYAMDKGIGIGFDSCSAFKFTSAISNRPNAKQLETFADPCESTIYSSYINVRGDFFPCSFSEGEGEWIEGISVTESDDFLKDVWYNEKTVKFRNNVIRCRGCNINCSIYDI